MFRIGFGEDTHRLQKGRSLILGGTEIDFELGLFGHSDADVLIHAIIDALLGASALGDIGQLFPDTDEEYKGISSRLLLRQTAELLRQNGFYIGNIDATIIAQKPKLAPYREAMQLNIANDLQLKKGSVSVKFTTPEHVGPEGNLECITARAVALIDEAKVHLL